MQKTPRKGILPPNTKRIQKQSSKRLPRIMSKRLESISKPATGSITGAKPALKFKPKAVSRKTKEERDNAGKINTPGVNKLAEKNKRFTAKKPMGNNRNNKLNGTQLVISGPLSEGTISLGNGGGNGRSASPGMGAANPLLERLKSKNAAAKNLKKKVKKEEDGGWGGIDNSDSESDLEDNAIDMSKKSFNGEGDHKNGMDMDLDDIDTDLFPVRAERNEHHEYGEPSKQDETIKTEFHNAASVIPSEPATREATAAPAPVTTPEDLKASLGSPLGDLHGQEDGLHMNDFQEREEIKQATQDYLELSKSLKHLDVKSGEDTQSEQRQPEMKPSMFFMQLPCSLPVLEGGIDGQIGKIRIHKSGRMSMKIGKVKFDITRGGISDFVQEVVLVDPENGQCYHVGGVKDKITAVPHII